MKIDAVDGWICGVDFRYELRDADGGATIFPSKKNCEKHRKCCAAAAEKDADYVERDHYAEHVVVMTRADFDKLMAKVS